MNNFIPTVNSSGQFSAREPFNTVVNPNTYYTVKAIRTIEEMEGLKVDLYSLVFEPLGVTEEDHLGILTEAKADGGVVVTLVDRLGNYVYVLSTYLTDFPLTGGVTYEHMCLVVDLGPCPPSLKDVLQEAIQHIEDYLSSNIGIDSEVKLGVLPTTIFVSKNQHEAYEASRANNIIDSTSDLAKIRELKDKLLKKDLYIAKLESIVQP